MVRTRSQTAKAMTDVDAKVDEKKKTTMDRVVSGRIVSRRGLKRQMVDSGDAKVSGRRQQTNERTYDGCCCFVVDWQSKKEECERRSREDNE
jgi:hypothetical protein